ncbi:MAG: MBL fold metallo-hydrolase [Ruminococcus flavefaciens]|nr:MBL fold metallo-hydrolase [Ruminococcus flavefaciens]MCM1228513.1 MBL fold metallo-hydrolase [Ruminococcus flavefaciens]
MAKIYPLFSSSKGNAEFIGTEKGGILIDCGVSYKRLLGALECNNIPMSAVQGIFITHVHSDHIAGLKTLTKYNSNIRLYGQKYTLQNLCDNDKISPHTELIEIDGNPVACGDFEVSCFDTPHDTVQSCGYRIRTAGDKLCAVCTDLGHITETVRNALTGCRLVMIEANYDVNMLHGGSYPEHLKQRIESDHGHLSNDLCGAFVQRLINTGTTHFLLGHLSQSNNTPFIADSTVQSYLCEFSRGKDYLMGVAPVATEGGCVIF